MADKPPSFLLSVRFMLALLGFFAYATQYTQKINMSVAIVCMINNTALNLQNNSTELAHEKTLFENSSELISKSSVLDVSLVGDKCVADSKDKKPMKDGPFAWSKDMQGMILASYFIGYLITEIPGGYLSLKFGPKRVLAISLLVASLLTMALPFFARFHYIALLVVRFVIGLAHGVIWPGFAGFWASWAPPAERSRLIGTTNAGSQIGNVLALPLGGFLCVNGFDGGWPSIFYIFGGLGLIWFVLWIIFASNSPDNNRFIGENEKEYVLAETIETRASHEEGETGAPWGSIFTSKACLALFLIHSCSNWGTYLFLTSLPSYMKEVLKFDIKSNGTLSAVPYIVFWLFIVLSGIIGDTLLQKLKLSKTLVRKIFNCFSLFVPMLAVLALSFVTCENKMIGVALLTMGLAFTGCGYGAGFLVNYNDISGPFSGIVFGIGNSCATIPGIIAPYLVGVLTSNQKQEEWRIVFFITAAVYLLGGIVGLLFTTGNVEPWAMRKKSPNEVDESIPLRGEKA